MGKNRLLKPSSPNPSPATEPPAFWGRSVQPQRWAVIKHHVPTGERILDLGSGRGAYTQQLRQHGFPAIGVDITAYAEWNTEIYGDFAAASAYALPFPDNYFHTTLCFEVLEHCPDPELVLREIARCTSNLLIGSVPDCDLDIPLRRYNLAMFHWTDRTHCNFFTQDTIQQLLAQEGYAITNLSHAVKISPNNYFWDTLRLPKRITRPLKRLCEHLDLVQTYWSSIVFVARVPFKGWSS